MKFTLTTHLNKTEQMVDTMLQVDMWQLYCIINVGQEFVILPPPSGYQYSFSTFLFLVLTESLLFHIVAEIITLYATSVYALFLRHFPIFFWQPAGIIRSCFYARYDSKFRVSLYLVQPPPPPLGPMHGTFQIDAAKQ